MPERDAATAPGHSFEERLSPLLARGGVAAVPSVLVRHAGRLDLTTNEVFYLLHVLERKWGREWRNYSPCRYDWWARPSSGGHRPTWVGE